MPVRYNRPILIFTFLDRIIIHCYLILFPEPVFSYKMRLVTGP